MCVKMKLKPPWTSSSSLQFLGDLGGSSCKEKSEENMRIVLFLLLF